MAKTTDTMQLVGMQLEATPDEKTVVVHMPSGAEKTLVFAEENVGGINKPGIFIPGGWGKNWIAKRDLALAGSGLARVAVTGDSITSGLYASDLDNKNWVGLVRSYLQGKYGDGGSGFKSVNDSKTVIGTSGYTTGMVQASLIATTGTWATTTALPEGPGGCVIGASTLGATATYVVRGTSVGIVFLQNASVAYGSFQVSIDGVDVSGGYITTNGTKSVQEVTYSGLSTGNHTVVITAITATDVTNTASFYLCGVSGRNTAGVVVDKYGRGGYPSTAFANGQAVTFGSYGGASQGTVGKAGSWSGGASRPCDLLIVALGLNDATTTYGPILPETYFTNMKNFLVEVFDGVGQTGTTDVVILMNHRGNLSYQDATTRYYENYCRLMASYAHAMGFAYIDLLPIGNRSWNWMLAQGYVGNSGVGTGASGTDTVHLSDAGHAWVAGVVSPILG